MWNVCFCSVLKRTIQNRLRGDVVFGAVFADHFGHSDCRLNVKALSTCCSWICSKKLFFYILQVCKDKPGVWRWKCFDIAKKAARPLYIALLSDWRVSDSSPLVYLRERTCGLDIGAFYCKDSKICFVRLAYGIAKAGNGWKWKGESWFHYRKVLCVGVGGIAETWFYLVLSEKQQPAEKIVENCWAMTSWKLRRIVIALFKWLSQNLNSFYSRGNGSLFLHCKVTLSISVKIINQSVLCSTIQQCHIWGFTALSKS